MYFVADASKRVRLMTCKYVNYNPADANYTNPGNNNKCISTCNELC